MKRMFLYLPLLLLAMLFAGCSNEEDEDIQDTPVPTALPYRIDVYNADGTKCEIPPTVGDKIKIITNACEEAPDDSWSNRINYHGNSLYGEFVYWSDQHAGHWDNIVYTITLSSKSLFNDDKARTMIIIIDGDKESPIKVIPDGQHLAHLQGGYIKRLYSADMSISYEELFEYYERVEDFVLPIRLTLAPAES